MSDKLLVDTSVWLDLVKDYRLSAVLTAIEDLIAAGTIELIMPQIVLDEFARNRDRVVEQSRRSFSSHIKRVREAVTEFGEEDRRAATLRELSEVEQKIAMKGEGSRRTLERIESVMRSSPSIAASEEAKSRVVERALAKLAPFHRSRNAVGDPDMEYPAIVDGARRCPPEDVGGPDGFMDFLEGVLDSAHEQHRDMVRWYGGPFDPIGLDEKRARFGMENMARRRRGPLASHRTGSRRPKG